MKKYRIKWIAIRTGNTGYTDKFDDKDMAQLLADQMNAEYGDIVSHIVEEVDDTQETVTGESND